MDQKTYRFVFHFDPTYLNQNAHDSDALTFIIPLYISKEKAQHFEEYGIYEGNFKEILDELESDYGVHDFHTTRFDGDFYELAGYSSYEVPEDKYMELLTKWRDGLARLGLNPGEIFSMPTKEYEDNFF